MADTMKKVSLSVSPGKIKGWSDEGDARCGRMEITPCLALPILVGLMVWFLEGSKMRGNLI
ncbi:MAG: hypothetical protein D3925_02185 [Candidatus Electrothrix sp. AR5]|nr:hypothetical protein [Candidatus Electrothrix sp. AR5]